MYIFDNQAYKSDIRPPKSEIMFIPPSAFKITPKGWHYCKFWITRDATNSKIRNQNGFSPN